MKQYHDMLRVILEKGSERGDRTGTGTIGVFGHQMRVDLRDGFPLLTTKKIFFRGVVEELLWFLSGSTSATDLQAKGVKIWDAWATQEQCAKFGREKGDLGPIYGHQWRNFGATKRPGGTYEQDGFDQVQWLLREIQTNPNSRRLIVSGWNPVEAGQVALPPCHTLFQFYVQDNALSCHLYQRSADALLGVPFNIASYALLTHLIAHTSGLQVGDFVHSFGDLHLYKNHLDHARLQLTRDLRPLPRLVLNPEVRDLFSFGCEDITIEGYDPHPAIRAEVSV